MSEEFIIKAPTVCGLRSCTETARVMVCITDTGWIGICGEHISEIATAMMFEESTECVVSLHADAKREQEVTSHV